MRRKMILLGVIAAGGVENLGRGVGNRTSKKLVGGLTYIRSAYAKKIYRLEMEISGPTTIYVYTK